MFSISLEGSRGEFWSGRRTRYGGRGVVKTGPHLTVGLRLARNRVSLPVADGDFTTTLLAVDLVGAVSRKLFAGALVQWDNLSKELQANIRIDWIHTPGSDLFLVLDTGVPHRRQPRPAVRPLDPAYRGRQADLAEGVLSAEGPPTFRSAPSPADAAQTRFPSQ